MYELNELLEKRFQHPYHYIREDTRMVIYKAAAPAATLQLTAACVIGIYLRVRWRDEAARPWAHR